MTTPQLHDGVRVLACDDARPSGAGLRRPVVGDRGTIVHVYDVAAGQEPAYIVECVEGDGGTAWLVDFVASELALEDRAP